MDFFGLFLGFFGRLLFGAEFLSTPGSDDATGWLKDTAMPDPDG